MGGQFDYDSAIVRPPSRYFSKGLTTRLGNADYSLAQEQWSAYCSALVDAGVDLTILPPELDCPDSCFVEDVAVILKDERIVIPANIKEKSRKGEEKIVLEKLSTQGLNIVDGIKDPGTLDGGDVRRIGDTFYIGKSGRTNLQGIQQFIDKINQFGYEGYFISVNSVLHLSTGSSYLGNNTVAAIKELAESYINFGHKMIEIPDNEGYAAGLLRVNDCLLAPRLNGRSFERTLDNVSSLGYKVIEIEMSEFEKQDGSLSCLSLLF